MTSWCNKVIDTISWDAFLLREACLWGSHLHDGVDQKVLKYTLKVGLFPFLGVFIRASILGMTGQVLAGCWGRAALCGVRWWCPVPDTAGADLASNPYLVWIVKCVGVEQTPNSWSNEREGIFVFPSAPSGRQRPELQLWFWAVSEDFVLGQALMTIGVVSQACWDSLEQHRWVMGLACRAVQRYLQNH